MEKDSRLSVKIGAFVNHGAVRFGNVCPKATCLQLAQLHWLRVASLTTDGCRVLEQYLPMYPSRGNDRRVPGPDVHHPSGLGGRPAAFNEVDRSRERQLFSVGRFSDL